MQISITHYDRKFTTEIPDDSSLEETFDAIRGILNQIWTPQTVNEFLTEYNVEVPEWKILLQAVPSY